MLNSGKANIIIENPKLYANKIKYYQKYMSFFAIFLSP